MGTPSAHIVQRRIRYPTPSPAPNVPSPSPFPPMESMVSSPTVACCAARQQMRRHVESAHDHVWHWIGHVGRWQPITVPLATSPSVLLIPSVMPSNNPAMWWFRGCLMEVFPVDAPRMVRRRWSCSVSPATPPSAWTVLPLARTRITRHKTLPQQVGWCGRSCLWCGRSW